jgi:hypothetical protein
MIYMHFRLQLSTTLFTMSYNVSSSIVSITDRRRSSGSDELVKVCVIQRKEQLFVNFILDFSFDGNL